MQFGSFEARIGRGGPAGRGSVVADAVPYPGEATGPVAAIILMSKKGAA